jgi:hypothetical protein
MNDHPEWERAHDGGSVALGGLGGRAGRGYQPPSFGRFTRRRTPWKNPWRTLEKSHVSQARNLPMNPSTTPAVAWERWLLKPVENPDDIRRKFQGKLARSVLDENNYLHHTVAAARGNRIECPQAESTSLGGYTEPRDSQTAPPAYRRGPPAAVRPFQPGALFRHQTMNALRARVSGLQCRRREPPPKR